jgi:hypothetical protein
MAQHLNKRRDAGWVEQARYGNLTPIDTDRAAFSRVVNSYDLGNRTNFRHVSNLERTDALIVAVYRQRLASGVRWPLDFVHDNPFEPSPA